MRSLTLSLLIELHDNQLQLEQRTIDVLSLCNCLLVIVARLVDTLRTGQIHDV